mgnify:CR=1 FL=1
MQISCLKVADIELPREVSGLYDLAYNLWWSWTPQARDLFSSIDGAKWALYRNPVELLINIDPMRWYSLLDDEVFRATEELGIDLSRPERPENED